MTFIRKGSFKINFFFQLLEQSQWHSLIQELILCFGDYRTRRYQKWPLAKKNYIFSCFKQIRLFVLVLFHSRCVVYGLSNFHWWFLEFKVFITSLVKRKSTFTHFIIKETSTDKEQPFVFISILYALTWYRIFHANKNLSLKVYFQLIKHFFIRKIILDHIVNSAMYTLCQS